MKERPGKTSIFLSEFDSRLEKGIFLLRVYSPTQGKAVIGKIILLPWGKFIVAGDHYCCPFELFIKSNGTVGFSGKNKPGPAFS